MIWQNTIAGTSPGMSYLQGLMQQDHVLLSTFFAADPQIHDPWFGRIKGEEALRGFTARVGHWLANNAEFELRHVTDTGDYVAEESVVRFEFDGDPVEMFVAVAADRDARGLYDELRVYYRTVVIDPQRSIRQPLLQGSPDAAPPRGSTLARYMEALASGEVSTVLAMFEPDGSFLGGELYDREALEATLYPQIFELGGGAVLEHCKLHDDGTTYVLEFNALTRGPLTNHPQAGIAIYERGPSGLIQSARVYDDIQDPRPGDRWA